MSFIPGSSCKRMCVRVRTELNSGRNESHPGMKSPHVNVPIVTSPGSPHLHVHGLGITVVLSETYSNQPIRLTNTDRDCAALSSCKQGWWMASTGLVIVILIVKSTFFLDSHALHVSHCSCLHLFRILQIHSFHVNN